MVADIGAAGADRASGSSRRIGWLARGRGCRAWRACWRWPSGIPFGTNEPIADQSASSSHFDWLRVAEVIRISPNAYPRTHGQVGSRLIEGGWELTGSVSDKKPDKKIRRRYHRGRNDSGYECVRALLRDYSGSHRQYYRVSG